jgi:hypothetical protein
MKDYRFKGISSASEERVSYKYQCEYKTPAFQGRGKADKRIFFDEWSQIDLFVF